MAFNGSGVFVRLYNWVNDAAANIKIRADRMDAEFNGIASGLTNCVTKDGQTTITANLPLSGYKFTGGGVATASTEYATYGQIMTFKTLPTVGGTADAITIAHTIPYAALYTGMEISWLSGGANTGAVTIAVDGQAAKAVTRDGATALSAGNIPNGQIVSARYNGTQFELTEVDGKAAFIHMSNVFVGTQTIDTIQASGSAGVITKNSGGTTVLTLGAGGGTGATFAGGVNITGLTTLSAALNTAKGTDIASATTTNIGAAVGNFVHITGTTTITAFDTVAAGITRTVRFAGALTLTHNATSLILPSGANITTAANDTAEFISEGSGNWRCTLYQKADGRSIIPSSFKTSTVALTSGTSQDLVIPSGVSQFTVSISNMSLNASSQPCLLINLAGSGYASTQTFASTAVGTSTSSAVILLTSAALAATANLYGSVTFTQVDASTHEWTWSGVMGDPTIPSSFLVSGGVDLAAEPTGVRITTVAGTATLDSGKARAVGIY